MKTKLTTFDPDPEEIAAALRSITSTFAGLTQVFVDLGENLMATIKAVEAAKEAALAACGQWPFQPGDVVHDAGPDGDDAAWLHAAPVDTMVIDAAGAEWKRLRLRWNRIDDTGIVTSRDLAHRGPITVVSVGETTATALADSESGVADAGFLLTFLMVIGLVCFGTGVVVLVDAVIS